MTTTADEAVGNGTPPDRKSQKRGLLVSPPPLVIRAKCFKMSQKTALLVMWSHCDAEGWCWPSAPELAEEMGCDVKTARLALAWLVQEGIVQELPQRGQSSYFRISLDQVSNYVTAHTLPKNGQGEAGTLPKNGRGVYPKTGRVDPPSEPYPKTVPLPETGRVPYPKTGTEGNSSKVTARGVPRPSKLAVQGSLLSVVEDARVVAADAAFVASVRKKFPDLDFDWEGQKWLENLEGKERRGEKLPSNLKNSYRNWMEIAENTRLQRSMSSNGASPAAAHANDHRNGTARNGRNDGERSGAYPPVTGRSNGYHPFAPTDADRSRYASYVRSFEDVEGPPDRNGGGARDGP